MNLIDQILEQVKTLSEAERLTLAHRLLVFDQPAVTAEVEAAWGLVIRERIRRYDEGNSCVYDANEVFRELDRRLKQ